MNPLLPILFAASSGCAKNAPLQTPERPTQPTPRPAPTDTVTLRFAPTLGVTQSRMVNKRLTSTSGAQPTGYAIHQDAHVTATAIEGGYSVHSTMPPATLQLIGEPPEHEQDRGSLTAALAFPSMTLQISEQGRWLGIGDHDLQAMRDTAIGTVRDSLPEGPHRTEVLATLEQIYTTELVEQAFQSTWSSGLGFFADTPDLEVGSWYELEEQRVLPLLGNAEVTFLTQFVVEGRRGCRYGAESADCVGIRLVRALDEAKTASIIETYLANAATQQAQLPQITDLSVVEERYWVVDPDTMDTTLATSEKVTRAVVNGQIQVLLEAQRFDLLADGEPATQPPPGTTLTSARSGFRSQLVQAGPEQSPPDTPPAGSPFELVTYTSPAGELAAYQTKDPSDGTQVPGIVWITGGDHNSIGDVWSDADPANDQSASAFRKAGVAMIFPSQRGGNDNPGQRESMLGEVDDVLAAADHLAALPWVDAERIYLGGHSTGGTLALLVAASTDRFRAVFSFGPVGNLADYGGRYMYADPHRPREWEVRSPQLWLSDITSPTFVIEGETGNSDSLVALSEASDNPKLQFHVVTGADHFDVLAPANGVLAAKVAAATAGEAIALTADELSRAFGAAR
ncbi:MAG: prolyl oligopeptidase family serine peptidase [Myxococcales bacterium]|nr:prolyl oligopeptidase family serine peptidase [Myxococcales bacterium]